MFSINIFWSNFVSFLIIFTNIHLAPKKHHLYYYGNILYLYMYFVCMFKNNKSFVLCVFVGCRFVNSIWHTANSKLNKHSIKIILCCENVCLNLNCDDCFSSFCVRFISIFTGFMYLVMFLVGTPQFGPQLTQYQIQK